MKTRDSIEELQKQLERHKLAHTSASRAADIAVGAFDATGDDNTRKVLKAAREAVADAAEDVGRSERLLDAQMTARAAEDRAALERTELALVKQLETDPGAAPLEAAIVDAVDALVTAMMTRRNHSESRADLRRKLTSTRIQLGWEPERASRQEENIEPRWFELHERILRLCVGHFEEPRNRYLSALGELFKRGVR